MKKRDKKIMYTILYILAIPIFGYILLGLTFLLDALFQGLIDFLINLFIHLNPNMTLYWYPPLKHSLFVVLIGIISWFIFKSELKDIYKAIYLFVPMATVYVTLGIFFYTIPFLPYILSFLVFLGVLHYIHKKKLSWIYYYSLLLISLLMLIVALAGVEI
jgi:hypothetical protein